jgi:hypothetical protein
MFHGTVHPFKPGDTIEARSGGWSDGYAYATPSVEYAQRRAEQAVNFTWEDLKKVNPTWNKPGGKQFDDYEAETPPRVYQVEPIDEPEPYGQGDITHYRSKKGFRVVKQVK